MSAWATPWAIPPWRWPSTSSGLRITPQSSTHTIRTSRTLPVSVSTSTTATWAPNGDVEGAAVGVELDVGGARLELVGDDLLRLLEHLDRRAADRRAPGLERARAV